MSLRKRRLPPQEVHDLILQTAREIAAVDGWSGVTVRKVSEHIGYTAPIIYEHFGSKDAMLNQILKESYASLYEAMVTAADAYTKSEERLRAIVMTYWDFAHGTPELYQLMYGMEGARATSETVRDYATPMVEYVSQEFIRFNPTTITAANVVPLMVEVWGILHGMISLHISGYLTRFIDDSTRLEDVVFAGIMQILRRQ